MNKKTFATIIAIILLLLIVIMVVLLIRARSSGNQDTIATPVPTAISMPSATPKPTAIPIPTATPIPPVPTSTTGNENAAIQNIVWQWTQLTDQGAVTTVPNPGSYTIIFRADETFTGTADCNQISGTYSTRNGFSISVRTSTQAYCGESSMDQLYLSTLADVVAGGPDGAGGLALETGGGAQRMQFMNGGTAP
jgi:heat shock protein HslJ